MTNKYVMDTEADAHVKIIMLENIIIRLENFVAYEAQTRYLKRLGELLDDERYKAVKSGECSYIGLCRMRIDWCKNQNNKAQLAVELGKYESFVETLDIPAFKLHFEDFKYHLEEQMRPAEPHPKTSADKILNEILTPFEEANLIFPFHWQAETHLSTTLTNASMDLRKSSLKRAIG